jgi:DNA polymerase III epsilon subunit family exonuclease
MQGNIDANGPWNLSSQELETLFKFFPSGIIAVDLETTGLSPLIDQIIEIAAFKITPSGFELFETLINPEIPIPEHTIEFHKITDAMILNSPKLSEVLPKLNLFCKDLPLVAHNAKFDLGFLVMALQKNGHQLFHSDVYCSVKLARLTHKNSKNHKLKTLVDDLNIPLLNHHRAIDDAYACLKVFIKSLELLKEINEKNQAYLFNLKEFIDISKEEFPEHLRPLIQLVQKAAVIEIKYKGGKYKNQFRPVKLTGLINSPEGSVLYARCLVSDIYKTFQLKKITEIRMPQAKEIQEWLQKHEKHN